MNKSDNSKRCYKCNGPHLRKDCPLEQANMARRKDEFASMATVAHTKAKAESVSSGCWVLDGGATSHMTNDKDLFIPGSTRRVDQHVQTAAAGVTTPGTMRGDIYLGVEVRRVSRAPEAKRLKLTNVLYCPGLHNNLLSERRLDESGMTITKAGGKALVTCGNRGPVATGGLRGGLYHMHLVDKRDNWSASNGGQAQEERANGISESKHAEVSPLQLLHQKLFHVNLRAVKTIARNAAD